MRKNKEKSVFYYGWAKKKDGSLIESWQTTVQSNDPLADIKQKLESHNNSLAKGLTSDRCLKALNVMGLGNVARFRGGSCAFVGECENPEDVIMKELIKRRINPDGATKLHDDLVIVEVTCYSEILYTEITLKNTRDDNNNDDLLFERREFNIINEAALNETSPADEAIRAVELLVGHITALGESDVVVSHRNELQKLDNEFEVKRAALMAQRETTKALLVSMISPRFTERKRK